MKTEIYSFLRWTEKYTKTDMVYLTKGGFWLSFAQLFASLSSFVLAIIMARFLPKETFGTYKYILAFGSLFALLSLNGMNTAVLQSVSKGYDESLFQSLKIKLRWGILPVLVGTGVSFYYFLNGNIELSIAFIVIGFGIPIMEAFGVYDPFLNGKKQFELSTKLYVFSVIGTTLLLVLTSLIRPSIYILLLVYLCSWSSFRILSFLISAKSIVGGNLAEDPHLCDFGKKMTFVNILGTLSINIDKIILFHYLGATSLAIYSFAIAMPEQIKTFFRSIIPISLPKLVNSNIDTIKQTVRSKSSKVLGASVILFFIYFISAEFIFNILFPTYNESLNYSKLFALTILASPIFLYTAVLQSQKADKILFKNELYGNSVQIILLLVLVYLYGLLGAIIARVLGRFISLIIYDTSIKKL